MLENEPQFSSLEAEAAYWKLRAVLLNVALLEACTYLPSVSMGYQTKEDAAAFHLEEAKSSPEYQQTIEDLNLS